MLHSGAMDHLTEEQRESLIYDIASRQYTATQLAEDYHTTEQALKVFVQTNIKALEQARNEHFPNLIEDPLWIANKNERLKRLQDLAELAYQDAMFGRLAGSELATALREFRSYLALAANELGQLLNRGSGDSASGDTLSVAFEGVDTDVLK